MAKAIILILLILLGFFKIVRGQPEIVRISVSNSVPATSWSVDNPLTIVDWSSSTEETSPGIYYNPDIYQTIYITFTTESNHSYVVYSRDSVGLTEDYQTFWWTDHWTAVSSNIIATGTNFTFRQGFEGVNSRFYKIVEQN